jgi:hypothetical protein
VRGFVSGTADLTSSVKEEAAELDLKWETVSQKVDLIQEIPRLSAVRETDSAPFVLATWPMLSGFQHGLGYAALRGSTTRRIADIPGGANMELTIRDEAFVLAAKVTYFLLLTACTLLERRDTSR